VSSFGTDAAIGDTDQLPGKWGEYLLASPATTIYGGTSEVQLNIIAETHWPGSPAPITFSTISATTSPPRSRSILAEPGARHVNPNLRRYFCEPATLDSEAHAFSSAG
jgi:Acyl-CoA dehydrogenase, C-terminal domain